jgi:hypothetical protein
MFEPISLFYFLISPLDQRFPLLDKPLPLQLLLTGTQFLRFLT